MGRLRHLPLAAALLLAGCETAPPHVAAPPPPHPIVVPPAPAASAADWRDWPISPGAWHYAREADGSSASYGTGFTARCHRTNRTITLTRTGASGATLTVQTSYGRRAVPAVAGAMTLAATDPLLDQIAFSRGHFSIEAAGVAVLVLPTWGEPARVIEDCRA